MKHFMALTLAAALTAPVAAGAATLVNGGFEDIDVAGAFVTYNAGSTDLTGWTIESGSIDHIGNYWEPSEGNQSIDLAGNQSASISQTITDLIAGTSYLVEFDMAGNTDNFPVIKTLLASVGLGPELSFTFDTTGQSRSDMGWVTYSFTFIASSTSELLRFRNQPFQPDQFGVALDNVRVSPVPLPASAPLLLAGLGAVVALRRKRRA